MSPEEISRIGEVNREEQLEVEYVPKADGSGFGLTIERVERDQPRTIPPWSEQGVKARTNAWKKHLDNGGFLYGAFDRERLTGFILLGAKKADHSAEVVALFVDQDYRRSGIGQALMGWAEEKSLSLGVQSLYVYANPTGSAVDFYRRAGFEVAGLISKEVVISLPRDIILAKQLAE